MMTARVPSTSTMDIGKGDMSEWMTNLPEALQEISLNQLAIPGSHDSGSFDLTTEMSPSASSALKFLASLPGYSKLFGHTVLAIATCQNLTIGKQLEAGIRHLDFRVSSKAGKQDIYFVHSVYGTKVRDALSAIKSFLDDHLREVVIVDIQHLHDMDPTQHKAFISLLKSTFGSKLCRRMNLKDLSLKYMWDNKKQVRDALTEIKDFLDRSSHPREIIILDMQQFHDMDSAQHKTYIGLLKSMFGSKLCVRMKMEDLTLKNLWNSKKQIICIYQDASAAQEQDLWTSSAIQSPWPNTTSPEECVTKLTGYMNQAKDVTDKFFVCQGVVTPDTSYVFSHCGGSVHKLTTQLNPVFNTWLEQSPTHWEHEPNIVIHDFIEEGGYVKNVLALNNHRVQDSISCYV